MKTKSTSFNQYLEHEGDDENFDYINKAIPHIGGIVLFFNGMEKELDAAICEMFTDRSDSMGLIVLHKMGYSTKVELFKKFNDDLLKNTDITIDGYNQLILDLKECARLRNLVVHADWEHTDDDGYTYVNMRINKNGMNQEYIQFSEESLVKIINLIIKTRENLESFWEERTNKIYRTAN